MMRMISLQIYLLVLAALGVLSVGLPLLLWSQGHADVGSIIAVAFAILLAAWGMVGVIRWYEVPWVKLLWSYALGTVLFYIGFAFCEAMGWSGLAIGVVGAYAMTALFIVGIWLVRLILTPAFAITGVARTLVEEAVRMRIALVFMVLVLLIVPVLPWVLDPTDFLKDRIQTFLTWSFLSVTVFLSLMTVFLAVGTITSEIQKKRIFMTMTKPVGRGQYLLGKWLGIILLDAVLLMVCMVGIYAFTKILEQEKYNLAPGSPDRVAVDEQVLVAREAVRPIPAVEGGMQALYESRLQMLRAENPAQYSQVSPAQRQAIIEQAHRQWYQIGPRMVQAYQFTNLARARELDHQVQLRIRPRVGSDTPDGRVQLMMRINGRPYPINRELDRLSTDTTHVLSIPTAYIDEEGSLLIEIANPPAFGEDQPTVSFNPTDGIEMLYRVGGFEANLFRAAVIIWMFQFFLAMLGLAAGSFLSFPVASVLSLMVFVAATASGFIMESFQYYAQAPDAGMGLWEQIIWFPGTILSLWAQGQLWDGMQIIVRLLGEGFMLMVPSIATYDPTSLINNGQLVSVELVLRCVFWVGVVASGLLGVVGWLIFRSRELAKVTA